MPQKGWTQVPVTNDASLILRQRKREYEAKMEKSFSWSDFLLKATEKIE